MGLGGCSGAVDRESALRSAGNPLSQEPWPDGGPKAALRSFCCGLVVKPHFKILVGEEIFIFLGNKLFGRMLEGKRSRGKQREKLIEGLTDWLKAGKSLEAIEATKDRKKWRTMIANAVKQGT
ncbi:hypothetical protein PoB_003713000 [Plakobranchus ocellatus]|uniref:Uncharacterized protein n=1 Tax=Plakobranchus ocellatus TaxID=259542 RepID=A0AAV4ATH9_9GAST|nr:hypothetical protein PoB_003713000 [Plakobranchus ocellatus]